MTFDPNIPVQSQSPGLFPAQMQSDLGRLKALIEADHVFNNTQQPNDGFHKQMRMLNRSDPSLPLTGSPSGMVYCRVNALGRSQLWWSNNNDYLPATSVKCFVSFDGVGEVGTGFVPLIRPGSYNVTSVDRTSVGPGRYRVTFVSPFVSAPAGLNYVVQVTARKQNFVMTGGLLFLGALSSVQTSTYVDIQTTSRDGTFLDSEYVGVTINAL